MKLTRGMYVCSAGTPPLCLRAFNCSRSLNKRQISDQAVVRSFAATASMVEVQTAADPKTLFQKLGGGPAVKAAVDLFYDKMLADSRVNFFFKGINMKKQRAHQAAFLTFAMGGSKGYEGNANMTVAHSRLAQDLGMRMEHFDIVLEHLGGALRDLQVPEEDIEEAAALVETLRPAFQVAIDNVKH